MTAITNSQQIFVKEFKMKYYNQVQNEKHTAAPVSTDLAECSSRFKESRGENFNQL